VDHQLKVNRSALREASPIGGPGPDRGRTQDRLLRPALDKANILEILSVRVMLETGAIDILCENGLKHARAPPGDDRGLRGA